MKRLRVNGYDMAYLDIGAGPAIVCVHGSLGDFRVWQAQFGPLSRNYRVISLSLRHFFPEHWDGTGGSYTIAQHVSDLIAFIAGLGVGKVHLMGHSRGGHLAFRVAQQRPDLVAKLILAEPGGDLDPSLRPAGNSAPPQRAGVARVAEKVAAGDIDGGLADFMDRIEGPGTWRGLTPVAQQQLRDNARTTLGQINEQRPPFTRADAEAIAVPTLLIGGGDTPGNAPVVLAALAAHIPNVRVAIIPGTKHFMFEHDPSAYNKLVLDFLEAP